MECKGFSLLKSRWILFVISANFRERYGRFRFHIALEYLLDQQGATNHLLQPLFGAAHFDFKILLVLIGTRELLAELALLPPQCVGGYAQFAPLRFLVQEFFEDDHFQRALP